MGRIGQSYRPMNHTAPNTESGDPLKRRALKIDEAAEVLGVSHWTVRRLLKDGALRSSRVLRHHLIPVEEIDRLLEVGNYEPKN